MRIRFVTDHSFISRCIVARGNVAMPFTPSHVEAVSEDGLSYLGSHWPDGFQRRPVGYDVPFKHELILNLGGRPSQNRAFYEFINASIGEPYDWRAMVGFLTPFNRHKVGHSICSAKMHMALRKAGYFPWPVAAPAHLISPRDLLLMISAKQEVPGI